MSSVESLVFRAILRPGALCLALATPAFSQWSEETLPTPRTGLMMTACNGKVYFAGGFDGSFAPQDVVDVYDESTASWSSLTMPSPIARGGAATIGDSVYFGTGVGLAGPTDEVHIYDTLAGTWKTEHISTKRWDTAFVAVGQYLVVAGGAGGTPTTFTHSFADIYDSVTSTWSQQVSLWEQMTEMAGTVSGGRVLLAGGRDSSLFFSTQLQDVDPVAGQSLKVGTLAAGRTAIAAGTVGPKSYFVGGLDNSANSAKEYEVYDEFTGTLTTGLLPLGISSSAAAVAGNKLIVGGGFSLGGATANVYVIDVDGSISQTTFPGPSPGTPLQGPSATSTGKSAYFASGSNVFIYTHSQELTVDLASLSLAFGGVANFDLDAGAAAAGQVYLLLGSSSGTSPGIVADGVTVPLNLDSYFLASLTGANGPTFVDTFGLLDAAGRAEAQLVFPSGLNPAFAGFTLDHAHALFDLSSGQVVDASNVQSIGLVP